jgi:hypothetical protein
MVLMATFLAAMAAGMVAGCDRKPEVIELMNTPTPSPTSTSR